LLVDLRNLFVHYKPEWSTSLDAHEKMEKRLQQQFDVNALAHPNQVFVPYKCLGAGCAAWSIKSASTFAREFFRWVGTTKGLPGALDYRQSRLDSLIAKKKTP